MSNCVRPRALRPRHRTRRRQARRDSAPVARSPPQRGAGGMIEVGDLSFRTQVELGAYVRAIRDKYPDGAQIAPPDDRFLYHLLKRHPDYRPSSGAASITSSSGATGSTRAASMPSTAPGLQPRFLSASASPGAAQPRSGKHARPRARRSPIRSYGSAIRHSPRRHRARTAWRRSPRRLATSTIGRRSSFTVCGSCFVKSTPSSSLARAKSKPGRACGSSAITAPGSSGSISTVSTPA